MSIHGKATLRFELTESTASDHGTPNTKEQLEALYDFVAGTSDGQVSKAFSDQRTLTSLAADNHDLAGGTADPLSGNTQTFTKLLGILIKASEDNTDDILVGNGTGPIVGGPFGTAGANEISVGPGESFSWVSNTGLTVTATTGDILKVRNPNTGTTAVYDIILLGH